MRGPVTVTAAVVLLTLGGAAAAAAQSYTVELRSFQEVPAIVSAAQGTFTAQLDEGAQTLQYELEYAALEGTVTQAHLHLAQPGVNGAIFVFLCSNLGNGPAGTSACPQGGTVAGTITKDKLLAAAAQGLSGNADSLFEDVVAALRGGVVYVNVHSSLFPAGEIRGQLAEGPAVRLCTTAGADLCLGGRFRVRAHWMATSGASGDAVASQITTDTGYFVFFSESNVEIVIKVLDGCGITGRYWVFASGLTDVETELTVVDLQTGAEVSYLNPPMTPFAPILDTSALDICP
jgi:hypothetical protein